eukprot:5370884-Prymnesium_polylepis.1
MVALRNREQRRLSNLVEGRGRDAGEARGAARPQLRQLVVHIGHLAECGADVASHRWGDDEWLLLRHAHPVGKLDGGRVGTAREEHPQRAVAIARLLEPCVHGQIIVVEEQVAETACEGLQRPPVFGLVVVEEDEGAFLVDAVPTNADKVLEARPHMVHGIVARIDVERGLCWAQDGDLRGGRRLAKEPCAQASVGAGLDDVQRIKRTHSAPEHAAAH